MDILTPANNTTLGSGWFPLETYRAESFRWVTNDAEVYVAALRNIKHYLNVHLEPGPGLNLKPFELLVKDEGETIARTTVKGRQMISIELPATEPMVRKLVLHVEGGGKAAPNDERVLNFRVFKLTFTPALVDVLPPDLGAKLGSGWYPIETYNGETFRWAGNDPKINVSESAGLKTLLLEVEPGPGVNSRPFVLRVLGDSGTQITEAEIKTRSVVAIPLDGVAGTPFTLTLHAEGGGKKIGSDERIMNFRVFQYSPDLRASAKQPTPA
jgi:hypothetical protein